jgi:hypothetical protein
MPIVEFLLVMSAAVGGVVAITFAHLRIRKLEDQQKTLLARLDSLEKRCNDLQLVAVEFGQFIRGMAPNWKITALQELVSEGRVSGLTRKVASEYDDYIRKNIRASREAEQRAETEE